MPEKRGYRKLIHYQITIPVGKRLPLFTLVMSEMNRAKRFKVFRSVFSFDASFC